MGTCPRTSDDIPKLIVAEWFASYCVLLSLAQFMTARLQSAEICSGVTYLHAQEIVSTV